MNRRDLIANEAHIAATYRREASSRAAKNPTLAARLRGWAEASDRRAEEMRCGPLFGGAEEAPVSPAVILHESEEVVG